MHATIALHSQILMSVHSPHQIDWTWMAPFSLGKYSLCSIFKLQSSIWCVYLPQHRRKKGVKNILPLIATARHTRVLLNAHFFVLFTEVQRERYETKSPGSLQVTSDIRIPQSTCPFMCFFNFLFFSSGIRCCCCSWCVCWRCHASYSSSATHVFEATEMAMPFAQVVSSASQTHTLPVCTYTLRAILPTLWTVAIAALLCSVDLLRIIVNLFLYFTFIIFILISIFRFCFPFTRTWNDTGLPEIAVAPYKSEFLRAGRVSDSQGRCIALHLLHFQWFDGSYAKQYGRCDSR